jgi:hypothetical protein
MQFPCRTVFWSPFFWDLTVRLQDALACLALAVPIYKNDICGVHTNNRKQEARGIIPHVNAFETQTYAYN